MPEKLTREQFIEKSKKIHGDRYIYDKVDYQNTRTKVCITCPEHGDFWQVPNSHLNGNGCPFCGGTGRLDTKKFIQRARLVHGDKYDYSKVEYKNNATKVEIICPEHGSFWQTPANHLYGQGCPRCAGRCVGVREELTTHFIENARTVHGDRYTVIDGSGAAHKCGYIYDKVDYKNAVTKVEIICPVHGSFWQTPLNHMNGQGCPRCAGRCIGTPEERTQQFIEKVRAVHGDRYIYDKVDYKNNRTKVCITCPKHGDFWQTPDGHISGHRGCPKCSQSHLENTTESILKDLGIRYICQHQPQWLTPQSLDFYLSDYKTGIECQGEQHYRSVDFFGGQKGYEDCKKRDALKAQKCKDAGVDLVYIRYDMDKEEIRAILKDLKKERPE